MNTWTNYLFNKTGEISIVINTFLNYHGLYHIAQINARIFYPGVSQTMLLVKRRTPIGKRLAECLLTVINALNGIPISYLT